MSDYNLIKLNCDILCAVIQFVANDKDAGLPTISAISRTCKRMRFEGSKYLLSGTVKLFRIEKICSFCRFMLADKSRLPLLKALMLRVKSLQEKEHADLVSDMLQGLSNLYELDITVDATSPPWAVRRMAAAIASLNSLRILSLSEIGRLRSVDGDQAFETALRTIQSPLISLSISLPIYQDALAAGVSYSRKRDPIFLCSRLRSTLERLEIGGDFSLIVRPGHMYEYPRLKKLVLPVYDLCIPYLKPFLVSAPNLRDLQFGGLDNFQARHSHDEDILQGLIADQSRTPQEWRATNQEATDKTWLVPLESFKGTIIDAYATGLSCPVTRVHLLSTGGRRKLELAMLSTVLSDWRPSFLRLATKVYRARGYIPILPSTSSGWAEALDTLELRLNIVDDRFNIEECFNHIAETLSTLPATSLLLEFRCANSRTQHMENPYPPFDPFEGEECEFPGAYGADAVCYMQDELLRQDLPQRVRECMRSALSLRHMTLAWGRCRTRVPNRVICVDLDNVPHAWDRPGDDSDGWGKLDRDW